MQIHARATGSGTENSNIIVTTNLVTQVYIQLGALAFCKNEDFTFDCRDGSVVEETETHCDRTL